MKLMLQNIILLFLILLSLHCFAQNRNKIDSLVKVIAITKVDTIKINVFNELFLEYEFEDDGKARENLNKALELSRRINYKKGQATTFMNMGYFAEDKGNYPEALKNYLASLKIVEESGDKAAIASSYNGIGNVYYIQHNYSEALKNQLSSLKICKEIDDIRGIASSYNNIAIAYNALGNYNEAFKNHLACLKMREKMGDKAGISNSYNNIGSVYFAQGNYAEALKNQLASLKIRIELGNKKGISSSYINIGTIFIQEKKYKEAEDYLNKGKELAIKLGYKEKLRDAYKDLMQLDTSKGDYKGAYENHKLYILYRDSLDNEETRKKTIQSQMTYDFEKKEAVATAEHKKEIENQKALAEEKSRKQNIVIMFIVLGLLLVLIFAGFIFRSLKITRKQKSTIEKQKQEVDNKNIQLNQQNEEITTQRDEIEAQRDEIEAQRDLVTIQKEHIEEIHKEVTDSINYAKRIQEAILPVSDEARSVLGEYFILFKPKDIVSGDFYFATKINNWLIVTVADCTGHGVPGAFMSMLGISFLNEIVQKQEINKANQILNELRKEIINALQQKGVSGEQKDGMDISLLIVNIKTNECQWAGANNPLYIVRKFIKLESEKHNENNFQLDELKGDKMPIAIYPEMRDFTNHEFKVAKGDCLYLFSDGFADQFGGPKGRKFMYKQLKELLLTNCTRNMNEQNEILENVFENWKRDYEQIDDVTIIGICI